MTLNKPIQPITKHFVIFIFTAILIFCFGVFPFMGSSYDFFDLLSSIPFYYLIIIIASLLFIIFNFINAFYEIIRYYNKLPKFSNFLETYILMSIKSFSPFKRFSSRLLNLDKDGSGNVGKTRMFGPNMNQADLIVLVIFMLAVFIMMIVLLYWSKIFEV